MIDLVKIAIDGAILSALATLLISISMRTNPRIWLHDYPKEIQAAVPPKTAEEKRLSLIFGIPFLILLAAGPFISTLTLTQRASLPFWALFANASGVMFVFNVIDWLVLDWLIFCTITPSIMVIPGTQGMAAYKDYAFHFRGFLIGTLFSVVFGLVIAAVVYLLR